MDLVDINGLIPEFKARKRFISVWTAVTGMVRFLSNFFYERHIAWLWFAGTGKFLQIDFHQFLPDRQIFSCEDSSRQVLIILYNKVVVFKALNTVSLFLMFFVHGVIFKISNDILLDHDLLFTSKILQNNFLQFLPSCQTFSGNVLCSKILISSPYKVVVLKL